jgi:hypothetical protein
VTLAASGARVVVIPVVLDPEAAGRFALPPAEADALVADLRRTGFATYPWRPGEELADALAGRAAAALDPAGVAP